MLQVYGNPTPDAKNLALYRKAKESSLIGNPWGALGHAYNAIDGNTDSNYNHGSCTTTETEENPWWRLDLLDKYTVTSITITNRGDCCSERINGAEIHIGNSLLDNRNGNPLAGVISGIPGGFSKTFKFEKGIPGCYVNVFLPGYNLSVMLCEFEVFGYPTLHVHPKAPPQCGGTPCLSYDGLKASWYSKLSVPTQLLHQQCAHKVPCTISFTLPC
ncbi:hypothetical protein AOLI_G00257450 [Acnodon oligacanthus]